MTIQNYLIIENNVVTNNVVWDGDVNTWTPPADSIQLVQATTPAIVWVGAPVEIQPPTTPPTYKIEYTLQEEMGAGTIGFTWDGAVLTTNEPQPTTIEASKNQPNTTGTQQA
jgi:hypothetical protein